MLFLKPRVCLRFIKGLDSPRIKMLLSGTPSLGTATAGFGGEAIYLAKWNLVRVAKEMKL